MFAVIYRWRVAPDKECEFQEAWERVTRQFVSNAGSLGSRLHRSSDGVWVAYAQWPSRGAWESAQVTSDEGRAALAILRLAPEERFEPILLDVVTDYLVGALKA
jgi:quinol monooxygenase YgiN